MKRNKISLIGGGQIGGNLALLATQKELGDVLIYDIPNAEGMIKGKALDISQLSPLDGYDANISGSSNPEDLKDSDVVIITAGKPRLPGMSRDDLLETNTKIISSIGKSVKKYCPKAFLICITNPLDAMVSILQSSSKVKHNMCVGMAGILDSSRMKYFLSKELNVSVKNIETFVLGGHGDTMVPMVRYTTVAGVPIHEFVKNKKISKKKLSAIVKRTKNGGSEINKLLQKGSAFYAPASSAIQMAESYIKNKKIILPCAAYLSGEYGIRDVYAGVPVIIGSKGVEKVIELKLSRLEKKQFNNSVKEVKKITNLAINLL